MEGINLAPQYSLCDLLTELHIYDRNFYMYDCNVCIIKHYLKTISKKITNI